MRKGTVAFLAIGIWELIRFVAIFLSSVAAPAAIPNAHLNLLWLSGPALVLAALFFSSAYHPEQLRSYLPILRIGAAISVITNAAVIVTGSFDWTAAVPTAFTARVLFVLAFGILVVDLIVISFLLSYRLPAGARPSVRSQTTRPDDGELPSYDPIDIDRK